MKVAVKTLSDNRTMITNTATVASATADPVSGNNSATVATPVNGRK